MSAPWRITIRPFDDGDPSLIAELLRAASADYTAFFHPFEFDAAAVESLAFRAVNDAWFAIDLEQAGGFTPAGFYMLRGVDEGFADPMYGVFIDQKFSGFGLARLTLAHAESVCRLNGWANLLLKVDPANARAFGLYESCGFRFLRLDPATGSQVLIKPLTTTQRAPFLS